MEKLVNSYGREFIRLTKIHYRQESFYNGDALTARCQLDLTLPAGGSGFPTVVWFHGGGLTGGEKESPMALTGDSEESIAVVGCGYRLADATTGVQCIDCIEDAAAAVAWVLKNIHQYGGDPNRVFVGGHSAGAYLSLMVGMAPQFLRQHGLDYRQIRGLIPVSGQCVTHFAIRNERGIPMEQPVVDELAPLYYVGTPQLPPILLTTGDCELEMCGRQEENRYFWRMLKLNGHTDVQHLTFQGYDHGGCVIPSFIPAVQFMRRLTQNS